MNLILLHFRYEGKGAMTSYIPQGVIDGWSEFNDSVDQRGKGLAGIVSNPQIVVSDTSSVC